MRVCVSVCGWVCECAGVHVCTVCVHVSGCTGYVMVCVRTCEHVWCVHVCVSVCGWVCERAGVHVCTVHVHVCTEHVCTEHVMCVCACARVSMRGVCVNHCECVGWVCTCTVCVRVCTRAGSCRGTGFVWPRLPLPGVGSPFSLLFSPWDVKGSPVPLAPLGTSSDVGGGCWTQLPTGRPRVRPLPLDWTACLHDGPLGGALGAAGRLFPT